MSRRFDHLGDVETFITVVERGSLTAAAVTLSTTPSVISRALARLEVRLGTQLLRRTTRSIGLTDAGRAYLEQTKAALAQIAEVERAIQGAADEVTGTLRISAPTTFGHYRLPAMLQRFSRACPAVRIELNINNRNMDLVAEDYDFAIRQGELRDSALVARKLEDAALCVVAAPSYLARHGQPTSLAELAQHQCLSFLLPSNGRAIPWQLCVDGEEVELMPPSMLQVTDDALGMVSLAEAGLGLCQSYEFVVRERLARGALVEVLPQHRGRSRPFSLIYTQQRRQSAAARAFIAALTAP
jgi:DNA-binding transcriptional LysR family regulator